MDRRQDFNPRTYVRCDRGKGTLQLQLHQFQSTHLREVRLVIIFIFNIVIANFNPRTYVRCDVPVKSAIVLTIIDFNPRTYVRCDNDYLFIGDLNWLISIHAPTWGATYREEFSNKYVIFQSTHLREVRLSMVVRYGQASGFQSTHLREVRPGKRYLTTTVTSISIHAPTWGATSNYFYI